jgi:hypothetical protein
VFDQRSSATMSVAMHTATSSVSCSAAYANSELQQRVCHRVRTKGTCPLMLLFSIFAVLCEVLIVLAAGSLHLITSTFLSHLFVLAHVKHELCSLVLDCISMLLCICLLGSKSGRCAGSSLSQAAHYYRVLLMVACIGLCPRSCHSQHFICNCLANCEQLQPCA